MSGYFPDPTSLGLSYCVTKADLKIARGVDTLSVAKKVNLSNSKSDVDKLHIDKLKNIQLIEQICKVK